MSPPSLFGGRRIFVDSSAYLALVSRRDDDHAAAVAIRASLIAERRRLFTTNLVVAETHALVLAREDRFVAAGALSAIDRSDTVVVRVAARDERRAREIIAQYADKDFSLTDATSFAVMERLRIGHAFTFDRHFAQFGFAVLGAAEPR